MLIELREVSWKSFSIFGFLLMHNRHEIICRIVKLGTFQTKTLIEIIDCLICSSVVDEASLDHQNEVVEKSKDIWVWLMNGHYDCFVLFMCHVGQILYDNKWCEWVQSWGGLIQNDNLWIADKFKSNRCSLSFSSGNTFDKLASHHNIKTILKFKLLTKFQYFLVFLLQRTIQFEIGSKGQSLSYSESWHQHIRLHHIVGKVAEVLIAIGFVVGP